MNINKIFLLSALLIAVNINIIPAWAKKTVSPPKPAKPTAASIANLIQSAQNDYKLGNYTSAINKYKKALEGNTNSPDINFSLGASYIGQGYYELATEYLLRALELNSALLEAYFSLALAYQGMNRPKEALAVYRKGLGFDLDKDLPRSIFWNEVVTMKGNEPEINDDPDVVNIEENKAENKNISTLKIKEYKPPMETIYTENSRQIQQNVNESGLIVINKDSNYFASQIQDYEDELRKSPDDVQLMRRLALLYLKVQQLDKAQNIYTKLKSLNTEYADEINKEIEKLKRKLQNNSSLENKVSN